MIQVRTAYRTTFKGLATSTNASRKTQSRVAVSVRYSGCLSAASTSTSAAPVSLADVAVRAPPPHRTLPQGRIAFDRRMATEAGLRPVSVVALMADRRGNRPAAGTRSNQERHRVLRRPVRTFGLEDPDPEPSNQSAVSSDRLIGGRPGVWSRAPGPGGHWAGPPAQRALRLGP